MDAALAVLQRNAAWLSFLMVPATQEDKVVCDQQMGHWLPRLPDYIQTPGAGFAPFMSRSNSATVLVGWWPVLLAKGLPTSGEWKAPGVVLLDASCADDEENLHREWRRWLQLYNACQFMPGMLLTTAAGLDARDYDMLVFGTPTMPVSGEPAVNGAWQEVMDQAHHPLRPGLASPAKAGAALPEVGMCEFRSIVITDSV
jgi:DEAD/DEAH box helicase domain-containing protein